MEITSSFGLVTTSKYVHDSDAEKSSFAHYINGTTDLS